MTRSQPFVPQEHLNKRAQPKGENMRRAKVVLILAVLAAFLGGALLGEYVQPAFSHAANVAPTTSPRVTTRAQRTAPTEARYPESSAVRKRRSWEREVLIVGGSSAAGAAIGAVAKGGKGAAVGAVSGGIAGLIYDLATRNR